MHTPTNIPLIPYVIEQTPRGERSYDIYSRLLNDRIVFLGEPITRESANLVIAHFIKPEVSTICVGMAASMAAVLLACGAKGKRMALPNSMVLIHQPSSGVEGQQTDIQIVADETKWIRQHLNEILAEATGQPIEKVNADTERDNYLRAQQALEYGLVDRVITSRTEQAGEE